MDPVKNKARVVVSTGYAAGATTIVLAAGDGAKLPDPAVDGAFNIPWWNATDYGDYIDDPLGEIVRVTARTGDTLTVTRGQEGGSAQDHNVAGKTYKMEVGWTKKMYDDLWAAIPTRIDAVLDGPTSYVRVTIAGVTPSSDARVSWGVHDQEDPALNFSRPIGWPTITEIGNGYIDVRSNADELVDRRIKLLVWK